MRSGRARARARAASGGRARSRSTAPHLSARTCSKGLVGWLAGCWLVGASNQDEQLRYCAVHDSAITLPDSTLSAGALGSEPAVAAAALLSAPSSVPVSASFLPTCGRSPFGLRSE